MIKKHFHIKIIRIDTCTSKHTHVFNFTFHVFLIHAIDFVNHLVFAKARRRVREVIFIRKSCYICRNGRTVITHCFTGNVKVKFKMSTGIKMIESKVRRLKWFHFHSPFTLFVLNMLLNVSVILIYQWVQPWWLMYECKFLLCYGSGYVRPLLDITYV